MASRNITLAQGSSIIAGYEADQMVDLKAANSGGSIHVVYEYLNLVGSKIIADGQGVSDGLRGQGSGGRVLVHNICWDYSSRDKSLYRFNDEQITAKAGRRDLDVEFSKIENLVQAENGSNLDFIILFSRCVLPVLAREVRYKLFQLQ